jgi:hypothetical protein
LKQGIWMISFMSDDLGWCAGRGRRAARGCSEIPGQR